MRQGSACGGRRQTHLWEETSKTALVRWGRGMRENQLRSGGFALVRELREQAFEIPRFAPPGDNHGRRRRPTRICAKVRWDIFAVGGVVIQPSLQMGEFRSSIVRWSKKPASYEPFRMCASRMAMRPYEGFCGAD